MSMPGDKDLLLSKSGETVVKRETAPTSESAQFVLAWRSKDSVESAGNSQCEAQPGIGCNAIPEAAQSGGHRPLLASDTLCEAASWFGLVLFSPVAQLFFSCIAERARGIVGQLSDISSRARQLLS